MVVVGNGKESDEVKAMKSLSNLRQSIDNIDDQIVALLESRAQLVLEVKETKKEQNLNIYSPAREQEIFARIRKAAEGGAFPLSSLERIFTSILSATRSLIGELRIGFVGPEHSLARLAAVEQFGNVVSLCPLASAEEVVRQVESGELSYGVLLAESSSHGLEAATIRSLLESQAPVIAEIELDVRLALLGDGEGLSSVTEVCGESALFAQAVQWLSVNLPAASYIVSEGLSQARQRLSAHTALLAPEALAESLGLRVYASGIEQMLTRFLVIGREAPASTGNDKTSLLCRVDERSGALRDILQCFAQRGLTLTKIESKPLKKRTGQFVFFLDVKGHQQNAPLDQAIQELSQFCSEVKIVGSYPVAS